MTCERRAFENATSRTYWRSRLLGRGAVAASRSPSVARRTTRERYTRCLRARTPAAASATSSASPTVRSGRANARRRIRPSSAAALRSPGSSSVQSGARSLTATPRSRSPRLRAAAHQRVEHLRTRLFPRALLARPRAVAAPPGGAQRDAAGVEDHAAGGRRAAVVGPGAVAVGRGGAVAERRGRDEYVDRVVVLRRARGGHCAQEARGAAAGAGDRLAETPHAGAR